MCEHFERRSRGDEASRRKARNRQRGIGVQAWSGRNASVDRQKITVTPKRMAREFRIDVAGLSDTRGASGRNKSPNARTFARPTAAVGDRTPNVRSHWTSYIPGPAIKLVPTLPAACGSDRYNGSGSPLRPQNPAENDKPFGLVSVAVRPIVHLGTSLPLAGGFQKSDVFRDPVHVPVGGGVLASNSCMRRGADGSVVGTVIA